MVAQNHPALKYIVIPLSSASPFFVRGHKQWWTQQNRKISTSCWEYPKQLQLRKSKRHTVPKVMYLSISVANQIALQWHPDKVEASMRSEAEEKFKDIKEAYEILTDGTIYCKEDLVD
jgi:hypothetical protein